MTTEAAVSGRPAFLGFFGVPIENLSQKRLDRSFRTQNKTEARCRPPQFSMGKQYVCSRSRRRPQATRRGFLFDQKNILDRKYTLHADTSRFGQQYLEKLGWGDSLGCGPGRIGPRPHRAPLSRRNSTCIGGGARSGSSGDVSWTQNRDYEAMLRRLNAPPGNGEGEGEGEGEGRA